MLNFSNNNTELSFKATGDLQPSFRAGLKNEFDVRNERNQALMEQLQQITKRDAAFKSRIENIRHSSYYQKMEDMKDSISKNASRNGNESSYLDSEKNPWLLDQSALFNQQQ